MNSVHLNPVQQAFKQVFLKTKNYRTVILDSSNHEVYWLGLDPELFICQNNKVYDISRLVYLSSSTCLSKNLVKNFQKKLLLCILIYKLITESLIGKEGYYRGTFSSKNKDCKCPITFCLAAPLKLPDSFL